MFFLSSEMDMVCRYEWSILNLDVERVLHGNSIGSVPVDFAVICTFTSWVD